MMVKDAAYINKKDKGLKNAQKRHPERWSGSIRKRGVQKVVWLNPDRSENENLVDNTA